MDVPVINALPVAPTRADAQPDYSAKADTFTAALPPFSIQVNTAVAWMGNTVALTLDYKNAAASSANLASLAAQTAATQAALATSNGATQVVLAATQANNAAQSAINAQIYAAASQAAAGIPTFTGKNAFDVLRINAAKTGVEWGTVGQSVGDILVTARAPDATYAAGNRTVYAKSQFPDLATLLGSLADADRSTVTVASIDPTVPSESTSYQQIAQTDNSSLIIALISNSPFPCVTSADKGATWTRRLTGFPAQPYQLACGNGVFVATFASSAAIQTSTDGVTWTSRSLPATVQSPYIFWTGTIFIVWSIGTTGGTFYTSPDGITWTTRSTFTTIGATWLTKAGTYIFAQASGTSAYSYSLDGITWNNVNPGYAFSNLVYYGGVYYALYGGNTTILFSTTTPAASGSWALNYVLPSGAGVYTDNSAVVIPQSKCIILPCVTSSAVVSNDGGLTWSLRGQTGTSFYKSLVVGAASLLFVQGNNGYKFPIFSYDTLANFMTPPSTATPNPTATYIKGKLA
jgi:hypothetical protein